MASVPGEFDANYGLSDDEKAAVAVLASDGPKPYPLRDRTKKDDEPPEEIEDREREEEERRQAERDAGGTLEADEHAAAEEQDKIEARARKLGWVPKDEFKGDAARWRPADEWLERGLGNNVILRDLNEKLDRLSDDQAREIRELRRRQGESVDVIRSLNKRFEDADLNGYNRAKRELESRMEKAVGEADVDGYKAAQADLKRLEDAGPPKPAVPERQEPEDRRGNGDDRPDPAIVQWAEQNPWFNRAKEPELFEYADLVNRQLQREYEAAGKTEKDVGGIVHLHEVARRVKQRYPERFDQENPRRSAPSSVRTPAGERRGTNGSGKPSHLQRTYANLPQDAKDACDKQIRAMGNGKDGKPYYSREKYCLTYDWPREFYI